MKKILCLLLILMCLQQFANAQATKSYPFAVGRTGCGSGTSQIHFYNYNSTTNVIQNASGGLVNPCVPQLRLGLPINGTQRFTSSLASVSFNPKDKKIYYFYTNLTAPVKTYAWSWPVGTCPGTAANKLDTIRSFAADILGVAFDNNGNGYLLEFTTVPVAGLYKAMLRSINFTTGVMGAADTLNLTGGAKIYATGSGDVAITPSGQMFFVVNNKLFTPNYSAYTGTGSSITCTYIDTVKTTNNFVGLTYAEGKTLAAYSGGTCVFEEIDPLTAVNSAVTKNNVPTNVYSTSDFATIVSGIGAAKSLVSVTPTGTALQYDVVYDIVVKNYGNMNLTNVQVSDNLAAINFAPNVTNIVVTIPVNPNGYTVNPAYTGVGSNNLLNGTPGLPNFPSANNSFTIRIACRLSNIQNGIIYNNQATATATDYNANPLTDLSTNGTLPDLNSNDKPDDAGESQPTPLLISVVPQTPPCASLTRILFSQDFGSGTGLAGTVPAPVLSSGVTVPVSATGYTVSTTPPIDVERITVSNNANNANTADFVSLADHTGNPNGRMLIVNADAANTVISRGGFTYTLCANQQYSLSFYAAFLGNNVYKTVCDAFGGFRYPKIKIRIRDGGTGLIITEVATDTIKNTTWQQYGVKFVSPASYTSILFDLINDAPGGCGNDFAIDDIQFGSCDPIPSINASVTSGCIGGTTTFSGDLTDPGALPGAKQYQWEVATAIGGPYTTIGGATSATYTITPLTAGDIGKYYRVLVAATGNIGNANCRFTSTGVLLTGKALSTAAATATKNKNSICPGISVNLGITGGTLGANANWKWYSGSAGGTPEGTGAGISVTPAATTTYYVRAEGDCNTTAAQSITVFISCDIDKDDDGIADVLESNIPAALANAYNTGYAGYTDNNADFINDNFQADGDSDNDGIPNYSDLTFPGRVDTNADGVDDRFDADLDGKINMLDLDSDNDGIPDVVEAYGVDADGDGKIDNFTDTDGDGLSQNVDANNTGANNTGMGLGNIDMDGDGVPNFIDLDSDNDGIPDIIETGATDVNNNGKIDGVITDANGNGFADNYEGAVNAILKTGADVGGDGKADSYPNKNKDNDFRPNAYDMDSDGDGIIDLTESGLPDNVAPFSIVDGVIGANGWSATVSGMAALNLRITDTDSYPDYLDIDADNDGIPDNIEGQPTATYKMPGTVDTDGDGLADTYETAGTIGVFGGTGNGFYDNGGSPLPDYRDLDSDGDGQLDIKEGHDFNLNGIADDLVTLTGLDTDGDGLDNRFDSLNSVTNLKGTSYMMGLNGSLTGDATPGARCPVQKKVPSQLDRDWRFITSVLPVQLLNFTANTQNTKVLLSWSIQTAKAIDYVEIERSTNNSTFIKAGIVADAVKLNEQQSFGFADDIAAINSDIIYYRLKIIGKAGEIKYSNTLVVRSSQTKIPLSILPNPAHDYVNVKFTAEKAGAVTVRLVDNTGKTVLQHNQLAGKGNNNIQLNNLEKYSNGMYTLQVLFNNEIVTQRLMLSK
jgi:Secretion system C-terminal sorting domain/Ig-like domain CHU_C associated